MDVCLGDLVWILYSGEEGGIIYPFDIYVAKRLEVTENVSCARLGREAMHPKYILSGWLVYTW